MKSITHIKIVILNLIQDLQRWLLSLLNGMRGRFQIKFGMTALFNNGGFTLIELLVVVLITGVLAAVALPQYKVAVTKSRVGAMLSLVASLAAAEESYYLANGPYATNMSLLDIDIPQECIPIEGSEGKHYSCGKYFALGFDPAGSISVNYCPDYNLTWEDCKTYWDFHIPFRLQHWPYSDKGIRKCAVKNNSKLGKAVCANLAGFECSGC